MPIEELGLDPEQEAAISDFIIEAAEEWIRSTQPLEPAQWRIHPIPTPPGRGKEYERRYECPHFCPCRSEPPS